VQTLSATAERLASRGHNVWVAATDSNLTERLDVNTDCWHEVNGVRVRYFRMVDSWTKSIPIPYFQKSMADYRTPALATWLNATQERFDIIHSQLPFIHSNRVCSKYAEAHDIPYFYNQHGVFDPIKLKYRAIKKRLYLELFEIPVCRRADVLIALTEHERATYKRLGLWNRVEIVPNGIDLEASDALEWPFPGFHVRDGAPLVLFMGRLHPLKGADLAVEAFLQARSASPNARLVMAGPDEHGLSRSLERKVRADDAEDAVLFAGSVSGDAKAALLARADVFLLPTKTEGFSISILEAMAAGCAVLTTPGAYFPELESSGAGWIVERDPNQLAMRLSMLLSDPAKRTDMSLRGRRLVAERYTWDAVVDALESLYREHARRTGSRSVRHVAA
jgi:glycosyltransferase involved in cell wall biosynthesis